MERLGSFVLVVVPVIFALQLLPQSVSSQESTTCGIVDNCTSQRCLDCTHAPAYCTFDNETNLLECVGTTSQCSVQTCNPCSACLGQYLKQPGTEFSQWEFSSGCAQVPHDRECAAEGNFVAPKCTRQGEEPEYGDLFNKSMGHISPPACFCFEENCTRFLQYKVEFVPPNLSEPLTTMMTTAAMNRGTDEERNEVNVLTLLMIILSPTVVALILIFVACLIIYCVRKKLKGLPRRSSRRPGRTGNDEKLNDQQWELMGQIGHGRYGFVYKALYQDKVVAIKIFNSNSRSSWENESNFFAMESTMHKNIVEYITSETRGSGHYLQFFMITKYYPLGSLNQYLRRKVVSWEQACTMIHSVVCGLAHLHSERYTNLSGILAEKYAVAHRDVKSANILVCNESGECVIADLGFAMILDPSADAKELANTGQVGTFRYMAPEALDARVHLQDVQSFKQIDVYALALVMWEVVSRCCVLTEEDVPNYQLPYEDVAGIRPTLEVMKDIVVVRNLRPSLPSIWGNHELLNNLQETIFECWDSDPEARLPAANVLYRVKELSNTSLNFFEQAHTTSNNNLTSHRRTSATVAVYSNDNVTTVNIGRPTEHSQSSPPPYYSALDPISGDQNPHHDRFPAPYLVPSQRPQQQRPYFQSSMPHIMQNDRERLQGASGGGAEFELTPRCSRSLRSSRVVEGHLMNEYNRYKSLSARNSVPLGTEEREDLFESTPGFLSDSSMSSLSNESLEEQATENSGVNSASRYDERRVESLLSNESEPDSNLNSDSGIQNLNYDSTRTSASESSYHGGLPQNDAGSDTLGNDDDDNIMVLTERGLNPVISSSNENRISMSILVPVENSGNSAVTVTSV